MRHNAASSSHLLLEQIFETPDCSEPLTHKNPIMPAQHHRTTCHSTLLNDGGENSIQTKLPTVELLPFSSPPWLRSRTCTIVEPQLFSETSFAPSFPFVGLNWKYKL